MRNSFLTLYMRLLAFARLSLRQGHTSAVNKQSLAMTSNADFDKATPAQQAIEALSQYVTGKNSECSTSPACYRSALSDDLPQS